MMISLSLDRQKNLHFLQKTQKPLILNRLFFAKRQKGKREEMQATMRVRTFLPEALACQS